MWRVNLVIVVSACFFSACKSASMAETAIDSRNPRLGNAVRYFKSSWEDLVSGVDMVQVENSAAGATSLNLTTDTDVAIVVHGRESSVYSDFANTLKLSLAIADNNLVIILVDWSVASLPPYQTSMTLAPLVADDLRGFLQLMIPANLNQNRLHLIGFDLGAHIVGITSRNVATRAAKITAMSPAGERWDASSLRLRATDAQYVEVIHSDVVGTRAFGLADPVNALDIYLNGGTRQPGCANSDNACHHNRSWQVFAATVDYNGHLMALRCDTMTQVNNNRCVGTPAVSVGTLNLIKLQRGLYRVNTGNIYPFSA